MQEYKAGSTTQIAEALHQIASSVRKRALILVISDLFGDENEINLALAHFRKQHHDVIVFHVLDPMEIDFSFKKGCQFQDMETKETITADPRALAREYEKVFGTFLDQYRKTCAGLKIDYRLTRTDQSTESFVRAYLEERRRFSK